MAKPNHTAYQLQADFSGVDIMVQTGKYTTSEDGVSAIHPGCLQGGAFKRSKNQWSAPDRAIHFSTPEQGYVTFGFDKAEKLLNSARGYAKTQFKKGERPAFFLRKLTMSEFMAHSQFVNYSNDLLVKTLYKKYLLLDLLREKGYQMS